MTQTLEVAIGLVLGITVLLDIFLLVLYARAGAGIYSKWISKATWQFSVLATKPLGHERRGHVLSFVGPIIVVLVLLSWALLLVLASALIIHPGLGTAFRAIEGETPTDFVTALFAGANSFEFIAFSGFEPQTSAARLYKIATSIIGIAVVPLIVTYLLEVYSALRERNTVGLKVHLESQETGDAAEIIAGLGPQGKFDITYDNLVTWADEIVRTKESHHFYAVLFYFRFYEAFYSVSHTTLVSLDTVSLIQSALDETEYGWLKESGAVHQLWSGALFELKTVASMFIPDGKLDVPPDPQMRQRWERRYAAAVERLQRAGIKTTASGVEKYISLRKEWDRYILLLAPMFAFNMDEIDTALAKVK